MASTYTSQRTGEVINPITSRALYRTTAGLLVIEVIFLILPVIVLGAVFQFPGILTQPGSYVLPIFQANRAIVMPFYYVFTLASMLLIPLSILLQRILTSGQETFLRITTAFGIITGLTQMLGFIRWSFLVPYLADLYTAPHTSEATRQVISLVYDAFNFYAGHAIGEHLGFLLNVVWGVMIGIAMLHSPIFKRWIGWIGVIFAFGVIAEPLELFLPSLRSTLETVYITSYSIWIVWLLVVAVALLLASRASKGQVR